MWPDDPDDQARLFYLLVLGSGLLAMVLPGPRRRLLRLLRDLAVWALIFAMVVIAYGYRDTLRRELFPAAMVQIAPDVIEIRRGRDGHFRAEIAVNGRAVSFIVDTGASSVVLARADAESVGIDVDGLAFLGRARTANGTVATASVRLDELRFGEITDIDVPASVSAGALDVSLLGMAYLDRFERIEIAGDGMRLHR